LDNGQAYGRDSDMWDTMSTIVSTIRDMLEIICPVVYTPSIPNNPIKDKVKKYILIKSVEIILLQFNM
jgi:hypothetical protein